MSALLVTEARIVMATLSPPRVVSAKKVSTASLEATPPRRTIYLSRTRTCRTLVASAPRVIIVSVAPSSLKLVLLARSTHRLNHTLWRIVFSAQLGSTAKAPEIPTPLESVFPVIIALAVLP